MRRWITQYMDGKVEITYCYVDRIERFATGKLLPVISYVCNGSSANRCQGLNQTI